MFQIEYKTYIDNKWVVISIIDMPLDKVLKLVEKARVKHVQKLGDIGEYRVTRKNNKKN